MFKFVENWRRNSRKALLDQIHHLEAQHEAVATENARLNIRLNAAGEAQSDLLQKISDLEASNAKLLQEKKDLQKEYAMLSSENNELEERFSDVSWQLTMAEEKIQQMKATNSDKSRNAFAAAKVVTFFTPLAQKSTEVLRAMPSNFEVSFLAEKWTVVTGYCSHCGSDITKEFCDERTALLYALLRTAFGQSPKNGLCAICHAEYKDGGF